MRFQRSFSLFTLAFWLQLSHANEARIIDAQLRKQSNSSYSVSVTVIHKDTGWDHFADKWDVLDSDGKIIATRVLLHPHEKEQPFTRSLSGFDIAESTKAITIRVHDSVHGYNEAEFEIKLP